MNKIQKNYIKAIEHDYEFGKTEDDGLCLDNGKILFPVNIRYETYGTLNEEKSNAILVLHALTGDAHLAGKHRETDKKPGWWDEMVGDGKPFDTEKYFIVCSNVLGGCGGSTGPTSKNPNDPNGCLYNLNFPVITINDMVQAQHRLMLHLGIEQWLAVAGGSMGGMQALAWISDYPKCVYSVIAIATTSKLSPQSIAFDWVGREAIMNDPKWNNGNYGKSLPEHGLAIARMVGHITYLSDLAMESKFGRRLQERESYSFDFTGNFQVESYLEYQGQKFVERFDANSYLYMSRAMDYFDLSQKGDGNLSEALKEADAKFMVISFSSDWLFPPHASQEIVKALRNNNKEVTYCNIESAYGHDAFLLETETLGKLISGFLGSRFSEVEDA